MNDRIDAVLVNTSVYHKKQCDFEGITNSIRSEEHTSELQSRE